MDDPFVGTWHLLSWELRAASGGIYHPLGEDAAGLLIYSADGYMAVSLTKPGRAPFGLPWLFEGAPAEKIAAMDSYASYAGRYEVREKESKVMHFVEFSLFPNWVGTTQERFFKFDQDRLVLSAAPFVKDGDEQTAFLVWKKAGKRREPKKD